MYAFQRCLCCKDKKYSWLFNTDLKGLVSSDVHCRDVYNIEIGNTVSFFSNTDYKATVSSVRIAEMSMLQR